MKKRTILLVDDEPLAIKRLTRLLAVYGSTTDIIGSAVNGLEAVEKVKSLHPDIVFLDIQMPGLNGFEVLEKLSEPKPIVVFATAFDQYAIRAFDENSLDYLLKPIEAARLEKTMQKIEKSETKAVDTGLLKTLLAQMQPKKEVHSITVKLADKLIFVSLKEISHFQASGKYVVLHTLDGQQHLTDHTITSLNEKLSHAEFLQVSRGTIVNVRQIKMLEKFFNGKYKITLNDTKKTIIESGSTFGENLKTLIDF